jgi:serine O-acetyltransferase
MKANAGHEELLGPLVEELVQAAAEQSGPRWGGLIALPSRDAVIRCVEGIRRAFFPGYFGDADLHDRSVHYYVGAAVDRVIHELEEQVARAVAFAEGHDYAACAHCQERAVEVVRRLAGRLPAVRRLLAGDVQAAFEGDPALRIPDEAIFSYPGIYAITEQRIAHELFVLGVPLIPRMITEHAHSATGLDIHPGAAIGGKFFIDHGTGVVIGETCRIGNNVRIY